LKDHTVLIGYGRVGHLTVDTLVNNRESFLVIDHDPKKLDYLEELNFPYIYGDATSEHILERAEVEKAKMVVVTIPGMIDTELIVDTVKDLNPDCKIVARVNSEEEKDALKEKATSLIYPEELAGKSLVEKVSELL
ncbi:MAG: NAD(P)-binding protein, partial [Candidatus Thermoplasmatota archaeon]